ncbi:Uncharacterised protein g4620 [Pycnogonum litorale]
MVKMNPETKQRLSTVFTLCRTTFQWGFVPVVLYLGFKKGSDPGMPPISVLNLLWQ